MVTTAPAARAADCAALKDLKIARVTIETAELVGSGAYQPPKSPQSFADLPAFCRVVGHANPIPDFFDRF